MVQVNIYYETLDTEVTEEKPAYDLNDFGCKYELYVTYSRYLFQTLLEPRHLPHGGTRCSSVIFYVQTHVCLVLEA